MKDAENADWKFLNIDSQSGDLFAQWVQWVTDGKLKKEGMEFDFQRQ
jgi:hypothetical protein